MPGSVALRLPEQVLAAALAGVVAVALLSVPAVRPSAVPTVPAATPSTSSAPALGLPSVPVPPVPAAAPPVAVSASVSSLPAPRSTAPQQRVAAPEQVRVEQALGSLDYPWPELGYAIRFVPYAGGLLGLADPATRTITVFVRPRQSVQSLRVVLAHEIGHALDERTGTDALRASYLELRGIAPGTPWFPCLGCDDVASPAGDFAEVFAAWLVGPTHFRSGFGPPPDAAQLQRLAKLFAPPSARTTATPEPAAPQQAPPAPRPSASPSPDLLDVLPS